MKTKKQYITIEMIEKIYGKDTGIGNEEEFLNYLKAVNFPAFYQIIKPRQKNVFGK